MNILNYAILQDIKFYMGKIIEEAIWDNREGRMNLGYPFLMYQLCKQVGVEATNKEDVLNLIKAIVVKKKQRYLEQQVQGHLDSGNESTDEEGQETEPEHEIEGEPSIIDLMSQLLHRVNTFYVEQQAWQRSANIYFKELRA